MSPERRQKRQCVFLGAASRRRPCQSGLRPTGSRTGRHGFRHARWLSDERCIEQCRLKASNRTNITRVISFVNYGSIRRFRSRDFWRSVEGGVWRATRVKTHKVVRRASASGPFPDIGDVERFVRDGPEAEIDERANKAAPQPTAGEQISKR